MTRRHCRTGYVCKRDHQEAVEALQAIHNDPRKRQTTPCRTYKCHLCGWWHLTSKALRPGTGDAETTDERTEE